MTRVDREDFGVYLISGCGKSLEAARKDVVNAPWLSTAMLGHLAFSFFIRFLFSMPFLFLVLFVAFAGANYAVEWYFILFTCINKLAMFPNGRREWK